MAEKSAKKKSKKAAKTEESVLGNLSATRPTRLGGERRSGTASASAAKTTAATKPSAPAKGAAAKPRAATAKAATSAPKTADAKAAKPRKPPPAPPAGWQAPDAENGRRRSGPPRGTEIVTTAVQAAGELAQIGATMGGQLLKRAARRIPRP